MNYLATDTDLTAVANAIRQKGGTSASLTFPSGFIQAIGDISAGSGFEYEEGTWTPTSDIARPTISFAKTHSTTPVFIGFSDITNASGITENSVVVFVYYDMYRMFGVGIPRSPTEVRYSLAAWAYRSSTGLGASATSTTYNSDNTGASTSSYSRYWASTTDFHPYSNSTSRYFRSGRSYKWVAAWKPTT